MIKTFLQRGAFTETSPALRTTVYVSPTARKCARQTSCVPRRPPRGQKSAPLACLWRWFEKGGGTERWKQDSRRSVRSSLDQGQGRRDAAWCRRSRPLSRSPALYARADPRLQHVAVTPQICRPDKAVLVNHHSELRTFFTASALPMTFRDVKAMSELPRWLNVTLLSCPLYYGELHSRVMVAKWRSVRFCFSHDTV